jgi:hypothetical protein
MGLQMKMWLLVALMFGIYGLSVPDWTVNGFTDDESYMGF